MLVGITQGAKELGVSVEHIRRQIRAGRWPFYKLGPKATRIDVDEIRSLGRLIAQGERNVDEDEEIER
jgi:excisionase family DNA binding protein